MGTGGGLNCWFISGVSVWAAVLLAWAAITKYHTFLEAERLRSRCWQSHFLMRLSSCLSDGHLLAWCSFGREGALSLPLLRRESYKGIGALPSWSHLALFSSQRPLLSIPWHTGCRASRFEFCGRRAGLLIMKGRERILIYLFIFYFLPGCDDLGLLLSSPMLKIFPSLSFKAGSSDLLDASCVLVVRQIIVLWAWSTYSVGTSFSQMIQNHQYKQARALKLKLP